MGPRGEELYARNIQGRVEQQNRGRFLVLDVASRGPFGSSRNVIYGSVNSGREVRLVILDGGDVAI